MTSNITNVINEYNKRILKITKDLFSLTMNSNFQRFQQFIEHEIETGNQHLFLWNHIEKVNDTLYIRILEQQDMNVFTDPFLQFNEIDFTLLTELRSCWTQLSNKEKNIIFECIQNLFKIARYTRTNLYDELLLLTI